MYKVTYWGHGITFEQQLSMLFGYLELANNYANQMKSYGWNVVVS